MKAGEGQLGTDESTFNMVLCVRSAAQLRATFDEYKQLADRDIEDAIKSETSGMLQDGYLAVGTHHSADTLIVNSVCQETYGRVQSKDHILLRKLVANMVADLSVCYKPLADPHEPRFPAKFTTG